MKNMTYNKLTTFLMVLLLASGCQPVKQEPDAKQIMLDEHIESGTWRIFADVPEPRFGGAAAVVRDPAAYSAEPTPPKRLRRLEAASAAKAGRREPKDKLHLFGGVNMNPHTPEGKDRAQAVKLHHIFDPATNTWTEGAPMPDAKGWPAIAVYRDKIYLFGGDNKAIDVSMTTTAWVYDPQTDTYKNIAPLPHPRSYCYAVTVGDYIYIFGARTLRSDGEADRSTFRYDPRRNVYKRMADMPEGARFIVHGSYNGYIYAVHGETDFETYADGVLKYDVAADKWSKLNIPRIEQRKWYLSQHSTHAAIGSKLFILGGWSRVTRTRSKRATYFDMAKETFGEAEPMPEGRCCGVAGVIDNKLYLTGGFWQWVDDVCDCKETWGFPFPR